MPQAQFLGLNEVLVSEFELIFFVAVAGFFAYKLWSVLGKTNGDEKSRATEIINLADRKKVEAKPVAPMKTINKVVPLFEEEVPKEFADDIANIKKIDPSFSLKEFSEAASTAFETVIQAYSDNNHDRLKFLLSDEIYADFAKDIEGYGKKSQQSRVTLVSLNDPELVDVELKGKIAQITLEFSSEQINFVEDKGGKVVEGSKTRIERAKDSWVFERDLTSRKPKWLVVGTDA